MKRSMSERGLNKSVQVRVAKDYPWQILDRLVDDLSCCLDESQLKDIRTITRKRDFDAYIQLSEAWGPQSINSSDTDASKFFARYQASALLKKFQFPSDRKARRTAALEKFKAAELACASFNRYGSKALANLSDPIELTCYTYAREFLSRLLGEELPEEEQLTLWSRHGPGSNLDTQHRLVSLYDKYSNWPYSCTSGALRYARSAIENDERWIGALEDDYRRKMGIPPWQILDRETFWSSVLKVVPGNRITFVPKNCLTDRSIAIEPCMNLYLQLGVDGYIRRRLERYGVHLDDQTKNQRLARLGSKEWTHPDPFVTLDLAAASDSISLELCRLLLPPMWYRYLIRLRSPVGVLDGEVISYEKISSMGNGYTFALESAIFSSIIYAVEMTLKGRFEREEIAVFGDDLIVRKSSSLLVVQMLNRFGFSLNLEKSFFQGPFRESCGADWFNGTSVRPVFLTSNPTTVMELWNDANRLRRILSLRSWGFEFKVVSFIEKWIPPQFNDCVGPLSDENFDSYRHSPIPTVRYKTGLWTFRFIAVRSKKRKGDSFLFRKLMHSLRSTPLPPSRSRFVWGGKVVADAGSRFTITSPSGVIVGYSSLAASTWQSEYNDLNPLNRG